MDQKADVFSRHGIIVTCLAMQKTCNAAPSALWLLFGEVSTA
jgi:hypothetical protein